MVSRAAARSAASPDPGRILRWRSRHLAYRQLLAPGVTLTLMRVPEGTFWMGAPEKEEGSRPSERPVRRVRVEEFLMGQTTVTQAQWRLVAEWKPREEAPWLRELDPDPVGTLGDGDRFGGEQRPVVNVSWHDAMEFCRRLRVRTGKNYTLPSEAQWEYACRAGTTTPFHFGATLRSDLANYDGNNVYGVGTKGVYRQETTDLGGFPANAWGLHDMHGNVWEWCADDWHGDYQGAPEDGRAWLKEGIKSADGDDQEQGSDGKLLRGGSWIFPPGGCRSACRYFGLPDFRGNDVGFRVCCLPQDVILYP